MSLPEVISRKDPGAFRSRNVRALHDNKGVFYASRFGSEMGFGDMAKQRVQTDAARITDNMRRGGHVFANIGVSAALTVRLEGKEYLVAVMQERPVFGDCAANLISGYVDSRHSLLEAAAYELSEEIIPVRADGCVIPVTVKGVQTRNPIEGVSYDYDLEIRIGYRDEAFRLPGTFSGAMRIDDKKITSAQPQVYYDAGHNSMQLVLSYRILADMSGDSFRTAAATLMHAEDVYNKGSGMIETRVMPDGLMLLEIDKGRLTGRAAQYKDGRVQDAHNRIVLSEAFAPKKEGIVARNSIPLEEYLSTNN